MATEKKMDYVILGLLLHEPLSGYEIKKRIDTALKYFWSGSYGSIYPTLRELTRQECVKMEDDPLSKRKKHIYRITEKGRDFLNSWLKKSANRDELHFKTLLKLFFSGRMDSETSIRQIENFEEKIEKELPYLCKSKRVLQSVSEQSPEHLYYLLVVEFGIKTFQSLLDWCREAKKQINSTESWKRGLKKQKEQKGINKDDRAFWLFIHRPDFCFPFDSSQSFVDEKSS